MTPSESYSRRLIRLRRDGFDVRRVVVVVNQAYRITSFRALALLDSVGTLRIRSPHSPIVSVSTTGGWARSTTEASMRTDERHGGSLGPAHPQWDAHQSPSQCSLLQTMLGT